MELDVILAVGFSILCILFAIVIVIGNFISVRREMKPYGRREKE